MKVLDCGSEEKSIGVALFRLHCSVVSPETIVGGYHWRKWLNVTKQGRNSSGKYGNSADVHIGGSSRKKRKPWIEEILGVMHFCSYLLIKVYLIMVNFLVTSKFHVWLVFWYIEILYNYSNMWSIALTK